MEGVKKFVKVDDDESRRLMDRAHIVATVDRQYQITKVRELCAKSDQLTTAETLGSALDAMDAAIAANQEQLAAQSTKVLGQDLNKKLDAFEKVSSSFGHTTTQTEWKVWLATNKREPTTVLRQFCMKQ